MQLSVRHPYKRIDVNKMHSSYVKGDPVRKIDYDEVEKL